VTARNAWLVVGLLAGSIPAQSTVVVPAGLGSVEGTGYVYSPTGRAPARSQFIYARRVLPAGTGTIQSFKIRRDGEYSSGFEAHTRLTEVWMSNNALDPAAGYSGIFAGNRGPDFTRVMDGRSIAYPVLPKPAPAPAPFTQEFALDKPFPWNGGALLVEFVVSAESTVSKRWYPDAEAYEWTGLPSGGSRTYSGKGCPEDFRNFGAKPHLGQEHYHYGNTQVLGQRLPAIDMIGIQGGGAVPLPFDLGPLGGPGCSLYTLPVLAATGVTDETSTTGYVRFDWGFIPNDPALEGAGYQNQQIVLEPGFNGLGMRFSRLAACKVGGGLKGAPACLHVAGYGQYFSLASPAANLIEARGLVMEWTW